MNIFEMTNDDKIRSYNRTIELKPCPFLGVFLTREEAEAALKREKENVE